ncbi:MAG: DNA-processing protein DprA, partial [Acetanaerobacterium sp.]
IEQTGVVISEYPPGERPAARHFPARNRIISGLCNGVVVVEAPMKSGALITAALALEQGRDIFAVPGSIFSEGGEGTLRLLRDGAIPVGSAYDILLEYEGVYADKLMLDALARRYHDVTPKAAKTASAARKQQTVVPAEMSVQQAPPRRENLPEHLTEQAQAVYRALDREKRHVDEISQIAQLEIAEVLAALTELELEELARAHPGRRYSI